MPIREYKIHGQDNSQTGNDVRALANELSTYYATHMINNMIELLAETHVSAVAFMQRRGLNGFSTFGQYDILAQI